MIDSDSRYADSTTTLISSVRGTNLTIVPSAPREYTFNYTYYKITGADRIDELAYDVYSDATQWWRIADANPEILDWTDLPVGSVIRVPSV